MTLPNFIIGGVPRGGTTSLFYYLGQHPEVYVCSNKEPRFFLSDLKDTEIEKLTGKITVRTIAEYESLFAGATDEKAIGEATPMYIYYPQAIRRIKETLPDVKLIFTLRDPIDRAYSSYWNAHRRNGLGFNPIPIDKVLTETNIQVLRGRYYHYLSNWYAEFAPSQIKIVLFDDLKKDALSVFREICQFLGIDDQFVPDLTVRNRSGVPRNKTWETVLRNLRNSSFKKLLDPIVPETLYNKINNSRDQNFEKPPPLPADLIESLSGFFLDDITQLESFLNRDLSAWKRGKVGLTQGA